MGGGGSSITIQIQNQARGKNFSLLPATVKGGRAWTLITNCRVTGVHLETGGQGQSSLFQRASRGQAHMTRASRHEENRTEYPTEAPASSRPREERGPTLESYPSEQWVLHSVKAYLGRRQLLTHMHTHTPRIILSQQLPAPAFWTQG